MTTITSTELGASGRYINLGLTAAANPTAQTNLAYFRQTAAGGGGFGYLFGRHPSGQGPRFFTRSGYHSFGAKSFGGSLAPSRGSNAWIVNGTWVHAASTCDGSADASGILNYYSTDGSPIILAPGPDSDFTNGAPPLDVAAGNPLYLLNREGLGREFVGDVAYIARWNRVLSLTEIRLAQSSGPLSVPSGLILLWANQQDLGPNAFVPVARSTFVAGALPPNTNLGGGAVASVTLSGITAGEAFGTAALTVAATKSITLSGVATGEAFGAPLVGTGSEKTVALSGIDTGEAFGTAAVSTGSVQPIALAAIQSGEAFGAHAAAVPTKGVTITLYDDAIAQASITGIRALWWDSTEPAGAPVYSTASAATDGSGALTLDLSGATALAIDEPGFLLLYKLDGTDHRDSLQFAGRVSVSDVSI